ncbi:MAG: methyltransferase family protein [Myxococcota bacterium]
MTLSRLWPPRFHKRRTTLRRALTITLIVLAQPSFESLLAGGALIALGQLVHFVAAGTLVKERELTTAGLYAHVRNPFYLGSFLTDLGFCCAASCPIVALVWFPLFYAGVIHPRVRSEEATLEALHGQAYREYLARVPRYLPSPRARLSETHGRFSWAHLRRNGELPRQLHHFAFLLIMFAKLRFLEFQQGRAWTMHDLLTLRHDAPGNLALVAGLMLVATPWLLGRVVRSPSPRAE